LFGIDQKADPKGHAFFNFDSCAMVCAGAGGAKERRKEKGKRRKE